MNSIKAFDLPLYSIIRFRGKLAERLETVPKGVPLLYADGNLEIIPNEEEIFLVMSGREAAHQYCKQLTAEERQKKRDGSMGQSIDWATTMHALVRQGPRDCHDCGAKPGEPHGPGCDTEICSVCGEQRMCCGCKGHDPLFARWTGFWPGELEALALGIDLNELAVRQDLWRLFFIKPKAKSLRLAE